MSSEHLGNDTAVGEHAVNDNLTPTVLPVSRLEAVRDIIQAAREDFSNTTWRGKCILGSFLLMGSYEWGPGNEAITPIVVGQTLDLAKGPAGVALTAAVGGALVTGQQLGAGFLARKTGEQFPSVGREFYETLNGTADNEEDDPKHKPFSELSISRKYLYSVAFGSSFNILRESAVNPTADQARLKKIGRVSSALAGVTVAAIGGGAEAANQIFSNNNYVQYAVDHGAKNPLFWLGLVGAHLSADYAKGKFKAWRKKE